MDPRGGASLDWGDGTHLFRLSISGMIELEGKCDAPFATIFNRVRTGEYTVNDIRETLRLGLAGGGMNATEALIRMRDQFDNTIGERGLAYHHQFAMAVLGGAMMGFVDNPLEQAAAETEPGTKHPSD